MKKSDDKGHLMVEAALIMPLIMLVMVAIIYLLLNLYNLTCLQSVVNISCEKGSYLIGDNIKSSELSENQYLGSHKEAKKEPIKTNIEKGAKALSLSYKDAAVDIVPALGFWTLKVKTTGRYISPSLSSIRKGISYKNHLSTYYIHDEAEMIRNIDLVKDAAYAAFNNVFEEASNRSESLEKEMKKK